jgi:hypothetical protein
LPSVELRAARSSAEVKQDQFMMHDDAVLCLNFSRDRSAFFSFLSSAVSFSLSLCVCVCAAVLTHLQRGTRQRKQGRQDQSLADQDRFVCAFLPSSKLEVLQSSQRIFR